VGRQQWQSPATLAVFARSSTARRIATITSRITTSLDLVQDLVHHITVMEVNIHQAKTHLSRLLQRAAAGEEITIARAGGPIARLVALEAARARRPLDLDRGVYAVPEHFDAALPPEMLAGLNGKPSKGSRRPLWT
jgi:prevent-host-death family protein